MVSSGAPSARQPESSGARWTATQLCAFRLAFVYFTLDAFPDLLLRLPGGPAVLVSYWRTWNAVLPWFGRYVLHVPDPGNLPLPIAPVLLGDFRGGYVLMLCFLLFALLSATVWTVADRRRLEYRTLHYWLRVYVRYALAFSMLGYGISKLANVQFRSLGLIDLLMPLGTREPRELLWNFMGFSRSYQIFTGLVECLGVFLLLWRRTTLLGSLLLIGALGNVLMLDIGYGMTMRRVALRLLLMAIFLTVPDWRRLADFFVAQRLTAPASTGGPLWKGTGMRRLAIAAKAIVILYVVTDVAMRYHEERKIVVAPRPALYGLFKVQRFVHNGREDAPNAPRRWQWVAMDSRAIAVQMSGGNWERQRADFDDTRQGITIWSGPRRMNSLTYSRAGLDDVLLHGVVENQPTEVLLHRVAEPRFTLNDPQAMHWPSIW